MNLYVFGNQYVVCLLNFFSKKNQKSVTLVSNGAYNPV